MATNNKVNRTEEVNVREWCDAANQLYDWKISDTVELLVREAGSGYEHLIVNYSTKRAHDGFNEFVVVDDVTDFINNLLEEDYGGSGDISRVCECPLSDPTTGLCIDCHEPAHTSIEESNGPSMNDVVAVIRNAGGEDPEYLVTSSRINSMCRKVEVNHHGFYMIALVDDLRRMVTVTDNESNSISVMSYADFIESQQ